MIGRFRPEIHAQGEYAVLDGSLGIADHGKILEVELRLLYEHPALGALYGRHATIAHSLCSPAEPSYHLGRVEPF